MEKNWNLLIKSYRLTVNETNTPFNDIRKLVTEMHSNINRRNNIYIM